MMSIEENKALVRRWIELWDTSDLSEIGNFVTKDYVRHDPNTPEVRGPDAEQRLVAMYRAAFPDLRFTIEHLVAEGDMVLARLTARGTHQGELMGIAPTGKQIEVAAMELYRLTDGKIAEQWVTMDALGLLSSSVLSPVLGRKSTRTSVVVGMAPVFPWTGAVPWLTYQSHARACLA